MAHIALFTADQNYHQLVNRVDRFVGDYKIKSRYEYLSNKELSKLLRDFFNTDFINRADRKWWDIRLEISKHIEKDFNELMEKYEKIDQG